MSSRRDDVAAFYAQEAATLQRVVASTIAGPLPLIKDACSYAWCELLGHDEVRLDSDGFGWLLVVAKHHACDLSDRARRERATGDLPEVIEGRDLARAELSETTQQRIFHRELLAALPERRR